MKSMNKRSYLVWTFSVSFCACGTPNEEIVGESGEEVAIVPESNGSETSDWSFVSGGLGTSQDGSWRGYFWSSARVGSSITPDSFTGDSVCVSGRLGAGYEHWAMVGWNIAQEIDPVTGEGGLLWAIEPGGSGLRVALSNELGNDLRLQIQTDASGADSYCAAVPEGGSGVVPWSSFTKACWLGSEAGPAYSPAIQIAQVAVAVFANSNSAPTSFSYCVLDLGPAL